MRTVIKTCVILHNLTIDFERENNLNSDYIGANDYVPVHPFTVIDRDDAQTIADRTAMMADMKSVDNHNRLQHDIMLEMWDKWTAENGVNPLNE